MYVSVLSLMSQMQNIGSIFISGKICPIKLVTPFFVNTKKVNSIGILIFHLSVGIPCRSELDESGERQGEQRRSYNWKLGAGFASRPLWRLGGPHVWQQTPGQPYNQERAAASWTPSSHKAFYYVISAFGSTQGISRMTDL